LFVTRMACATSTPPYCKVGFGRIVVSEIEAPNLFANLV
jgi:hypothetical protein